MTNGITTLAATASLTGTLTFPFDAKLGPLADNGGPTQTRKLLQGSPAIDQGKSFGATTDQRDAGFPRVSNSPTIPNAAGGDGADIGAYERDSVPPGRPSITASVPKSPANNNNPTLKGTADAGSIVRLYKTANCTGAPLKTGSASAFSSPGLTVSVADDTTPFESCSSPRTYTSLSNGQHTFRVRAIDVAGNVDPTSASRAFTI